MPLNFKLNIMEIIMTTTSKPKNLPDFIAYAVTPARTAGAKPFWNRIGAAWKHREGGEGLNIELSSLPLDGRITLLVLKEETAAEEEKGS